VLLEVCFLSNDADTRFISQQSNQRAVARSVYEAVKAYRDAQSQ
jgi:N-acetylmuramoyl-L-alanine amidase